MTPLTTGPSTVSIAGGPPPTVDRALGPVPHPLLTRHADPVIGAAMARAFAEIHALDARRWRGNRHESALDRLTAALEHVNELGHRSREALADALALANAIAVHAVALAEALEVLEGRLP